MIVSVPLYQGNGGYITYPGSCFAVTAVACISCAVSGLRSRGVSFFIASLGLLALKLFQLIAERPIVSMLQIPCVSEMFPSNGLEDSCHWTGRERTTLEVVPAISKLRTFRFFFFSERSYFRFSLFPEYPFYAPTPRNAPHVPLYWIVGNFLSVALDIFLVQSSRSRFLPFDSLFYSSLLAHSHAHVPGCLKYSRRILVGVWFLGWLLLELGLLGRVCGGGLGSLGYGGFCRWDFSVFGGGVGGVGTWGLDMSCNAPTP